MLSWSWPTLQHDQAMTSLADMHMMPLVLACNMHAPEPCPFSYVFFHVYTGHQQCSRALTAESKSAKNRFGVQISWAPMYQYRREEMRDTQPYPQLSVAVVLLVYYWPGQGSLEAYLVSLSVQTSCMRMASRSFWVWTFIVWTFLN